MATRLIFLAVVCVGSMAFGQNPSEPPKKPAPDAIGTPIQPNLGDPTLVGIYWVTLADGPTSSGHLQGGFAAFTKSYGVISNKDGTQPFMFTFRTAKQKGQNWIDMDVPGDRKTTLYGIYEIEGNTVRICIAQDSVIATHGRPSNFAMADPKIMSKLVLERVSQTPAPKTPAPQTPTYGTITTPPLPLTTVPTVPAG